MFKTTKDIDPDTIESIRNCTPGEFYGYFDTLQDHIKLIFERALDKKMPAKTKGTPFPNEWKVLTKTQWLTTYQNTRVSVASLNHMNYVDMVIGSSKFNDDEEIAFNNLTSCFEVRKGQEEPEKKIVVGTIVVGKLDKVDINENKAKVAEKIVATHNQIDGTIRDLAVKMYSTFDIRCDWASQVEEGIGSTYAGDKTDTQFHYKLVTTKSFNPQKLVSKRTPEVPLIKSNDIEVVEKRYDFITQGRFTKSYLSKAGFPRPWMGQIVSWAGVAKSLGCVDNYGDIVKIEAKYVYGVSNFNIVNCFYAQEFKDQSIVIAPVPSAKLSSLIKNVHERNFPEVITENIFSSSFEPEDVVCSNAWDKKFGLVQVKNLVQILCKCIATIRFKCKYSVLIKALEGVDLKANKISLIDAGRPYMFEIFLTSAKVKDDFISERLGANYKDQLTKYAVKKANNIIRLLVSLKAPVQYPAIYHRIDVVVPSTYWPLKVSFKSVKGNDVMEGIQMSDLASAFKSPTLLDLDKQDTEEVIAELDKESLERVIQPSPSPINNANNANIAKTKPVSGDSWEGKEMDLGDENGDGDQTDDSSDSDDVKKTKRLFG